MSPTHERSLDATYQRSLAEGVLSYQRCSNEHAVFPPRPACPTCGSRELAWHDAGPGATIYSATTISPRGAAPYTVLLLDVDDGFRMMSRIDGVDTTVARIGDRVRIVIRPLTEGGDPLPCAEIATEVPA